MKKGSRQLGTSTTGCWIVTEIIWHKAPLRLIAEIAEVLGMSTCNISRIVLDIDAREPYVNVEVEMVDATHALVKWAEGLGADRD